MAGVKGMVHEKHRAVTARDSVWRSIRIMRRFCMADLCRTAGAKMDNVKKLVRDLERHGYVARFGSAGSGHPGQFQGYRLVRDQVVRPIVCDRCNGPITRACRPAAAAMEEATDA